MYKKLVCIFLAVILMTACAQQPPAVAMSETENSPGLQSESTHRPANTLRLVTSDEEYSAAGNGNDAGYYYIQPGEGISGNLRYIDYASATDIYLSGNVTGNRNSPQDDSYISSTAGQATIFPADTSLYLVRRGAPEYSKPYGSDAMAAIYRMDLNGSNRKQIFEGQANEVLHNTIASDGKNLYLIRIKTETKSDIPTTSYWLSQFDLSTHEMTDLAEISDYAWMIGAFDEYIIFHSVHTENGQDASSPPRFGREILVYSLKTGELSVSFAWESTRKTVKVSNATLVVADADTQVQSLTLYNVLTGDKLQEFSLSDALSPKLEGGNVWCTSARDNFFYFTDYLNATMNCINLSTGDISAVGVHYIDPEKNEQRPGFILAANEDKYLICYNKTMTKFSHPGQDGTIVQNEIPTERYALIDKETYRNGGTDSLEIKRME